MKLVKNIKLLRLKLIAAGERKKPIQNNKILFWSDLGKRYSCNPRYLSEYILCNYPDKFDVVWMLDISADMPRELPQGVRAVRYFSREWLYEIATAKYIVCNHRIPPHFFFKKREGQVYIQTWHSSLRLKTIEKDAEGDLSEKYIKDAIADSKQIDYIISGCGFSSRIFAESFWYNGRILECGTPRIDYLLSMTHSREALCTRAGLDSKYKYALYAPTFRKGDRLDAYDIDTKRLTNTLSQRFGGAWRVLYRLHPNLVGRIALGELSEECINMTAYQDMQELLALSDMLITDYSSSMFDMAYLGKPCVLYVSDLKEYVARERALYFDILELPFVIAQSNEELEARLREFDSEEYSKQTEAFLKSIGSFEKGAACKAIMDEIINKQFGEQK